MEGGGGEEKRLATGEGVSTSTNRGSLNILKDGYLIKLGDKVKSWRKRYFVLCYEGCVLFFEYYKFPGGERLGHFELTDTDKVRLLEPPASPHQNPVLEIVTPQRTYFLTADTEAEVMDWNWAVRSSLAYLLDSRVLDQQQQQHGTSDPRSSNPSSSLSTSTQVSKAGYLQKKGGKRRNWKKRWFVLENKTLQYFPSKHDKKSLGAIALENSFGVHRLMDSAEHKNLFSIDTPTRIYIFSAYDEKEVNEWLHALHRSGCNVSMGQSTKSNSTFYQTLPPQQIGLLSEDSASDSEEDPILAKSDNELKTHLPSSRLSCMPSPLATRKLKVGEVPKPFEFGSFAELHAALRPLNSPSLPSTPDPTRSSKFSSSVEGESTS